LNPQDVANPIPTAAVAGEMEPGTRRGERDRTPLDPVTEPLGREGYVAGDERSRDAFRARGRSVRRGRGRGAGAGRGAAENLTWIREPDMDSGLPFAR
jgi:hypothetical protein